MTGLKGAKAGNVRFHCTFANLLSPAERSGLTTLQKHKTAPAIAGPGRFDTNVKKGKLQ
jgi:hypothetical protein